MQLDTPLQRLVGGPTAKAMAAGLDLHTAGDLLHHYPRRYARRGEMTDLRDLEPDEQATVLATVKSRTRRPLRQRKGFMLEVVITDGNRDLPLAFFHRAGYFEQELVPGREGLFTGKVTLFNRRPQLTHPAFLMLDEDADGSVVDEFTRTLIPVYPASSAVTSWAVSKAVRVLLDQLGDVVDPLPVDLQARQGLLSLRAAFEGIHRPESDQQVAAAKDRLGFDEAFVLQVELARRRAASSALPSVARHSTTDGLLAAFDARLPFTLTGAQQDVGTEIFDDLARTHPMHRLLQGEVGSGKTLVALRAMLAVVDSGGQAALLAPTEVLAAQHLRSITTLLGPLAERGLLGGSDVGTRVALVTGSQNAAARRRMLLEAVSGDAGIVIGTHALLEDRVVFSDLGLVVVDEQHRFGVEQRAALAAKGRDGMRPHVLVMTATPIPRTVAMTVFGDLEVSTMIELPKGRADVLTHVVPAGEKPHFLDRAWQRVREEAAAGHQAYVVAPRIGDTDATTKPGDEELAAQEGERRPPVAVLELAELLREGPLSDLRVEVLHGRLAPEEKDAVMRRFVAGEVDVLVATTVIEVGVDVANASVMVVMDAERFGVSQLHQLRGRIGRGGVPGVCLLVTEAPDGSPARARLDAVASTRDGFELSRVDLTYRREGDVLGAAQSGRRSSLKLLSVLRDEAVIAAARTEATDLLAADPQLQAHPQIAAEVASLVGEDQAEYLEKG